MLGSISTRLTRIVACIAVLACALPAAAHARWLKAESPLFVIYSEGGKDELRDYTEKLEEYDGVLRRMTGAIASPVNKLTIYLFKNNAQLRDVTPGVSRDVQGLYLARTSGTIAIAVRKDLGGKNSLSAQSILFHEHTHHFVYQNFPANYPNWTSEGLAEYFSGVSFQPDSIEVGKFQLARVFPLRTREWLPVENLFIPPEKNNGGMGMFYPESWLVTHYMMDDPARRAKLDGFLKAVGRGEDTAAAFSSRFGMDFAEFDKVMKAYLDKGELVVQSPPRSKTKPEVVITALPASADKLLLPHAQFVMSSLAEQSKSDLYFGAKDLKYIRKQAAKFPGDALALRTLAAGEMLYGDLSKADAALDKVLAQKPDDVEALYLKAARYIIEGRKEPTQRATLFAQAKPVAGEIYKLDPNHYPALYIYSLGALANTTPPTENTLNVLKLAHQLAPQVDDISLEAAVALSNAGQTSDARHLLEQVANAPHANELSVYAKGLLNQVAEGKAITHVAGEVPRAIKAPK